MNYILFKANLFVLPEKILLNFLSILPPNQNKLSKILLSIPNEKLDYILKRVNYYNKIENNNQFNSTWLSFLI